MCQEFIGQADRRTYNKKYSFLLEMQISTLKKNFRWKNQILINYYKACRYGKEANISILYLRKENWCNGLKVMEVIV